MYRGIRYIVITIMIILLLLAAMFAGKGIVQMVLDIRNGVESTYVYNPRQRLRESIVLPEQQKMLAYIEENRELLVEIASMEMPEGTLSIQLDETGSAMCYGVWKEPIAPHTSPAVLEVLRGGVVSYILTEGVPAFATGGVGGVLSSGDWGFYYSPDNQPHCAGEIEGSPIFDRDGDGWWLDTENYEGSGMDWGEYYTERIDGQFFYYEIVDT